MAWKRLDTVTVEQCWPIGDALDGWWYVVRRRFFKSHFLWPDGKWRVYAWAADGHAYHATAAEAEAVLARVEKRRRRRQPCGRSAERRKRGRKIPLDK